MSDIQKWDEINGTGNSQFRLNAFLESTEDCYAILQLAYSGDIRFRFSSYDFLRRSGKKPEMQEYDVVYAGVLPEFIDMNWMLEKLYEQFNLEHPKDFRGHSLSVSDVVLMKVNGAVSSHYVDSIGFKELRDFFQPENYLRNAELVMEDDYGMLDGIINNGKSEQATALEAKPSVLEQLRNTPVSEKVDPSGREEIR